MNSIASSSPLRLSSVAEGLRSDAALLTSSPLRYGSVNTPKSTPIIHRDAVTPASSRVSRRELGGSIRKQMVQINSDGLAPPVREFDGSSRPDYVTSGPMEGPDTERLVIWGTNVVVQEVRDRFDIFLREYRDATTGLSTYKRLIEQIADTEEWHLNLNTEHVHEHNSVLYRQMICYPQEVIPIFDEVVTLYFMEKFPDFDVPEGGILTRPFGIADAKNMRALNPEDVDQLITIKGMVIRASSIIPDLKKGFFKCSKCGRTELSENDRGRVQEPTKCSNCNTNFSFDMVHNRSEYNDKQLVKLQETPDVIPEGQTPHTVLLSVFNMLVDNVQPGDRVDVTGIYRAMSLRTNPRKRQLKTIFKTHIDVLHFKKTDSNRMSRQLDAEDEATGLHVPQEEDAIITPAQEEELQSLSRLPDIYERLTQALAPSIWEMEDVKKGVLCQLFGGCHKTIEGGESKARIRGDINVLLVGDPGTSKSQVLQYVHKLAPRGIYTSGRGSSSVGLTAYITKDPDTRQLVLESGALVLSDGGVCCIDEFDKMNDATRSILHEAMEQQTVSIAKAGIICTLNARTSILAAANPRNSRYDASRSVVDNINLTPTLLSRFDLIYLVLDEVVAENDRRLASHIVQLYHENREDVINSEIDRATLARYVSYARTFIHPRLSDDAVHDLIDGYVQMRKLGGKKGMITATPRQLESLIRLAEAHARIRFSNNVERLDVAEALRLWRVSLCQAATDPSTGMIDMNMLATGFSNNSRGKNAELASALRIIFEEAQAKKKTSFTLGDLLKHVNAQSQVPVSKDHLSSALELLEQDNVIVLRGQPHSLACNVRYIGHKTR